MAQSKTYRNTIQSDSRPTLAQLDQARPYRPKVTAGDFAACKLAALEALRQAGPIGLTTQELRDNGAGERPPNRICDLRRDGHLIKTIPGRPFRFVLLREADGSEPTKRVNRHDNARWFEEHFGVPKQSTKSVPVVDDALPLFAEVSE